MITAENTLTLWIYIGILFVATLVTWALIKALFKLHREEKAAKAKQHKEEAEKAAALADAVNEKVKKNESEQEKDHQTPKVAPGPGKKVAERVEFSHPEVMEFWKSVKADIPAEPYHGPIIEILQILEREQNVPSMRPKKNMDVPPYIQRLAAVSLLSHSINTANEIKVLVPDRNLVFFSAIIAALGHDLGKIPAFNADGNRHPSIGAEVVRKIIRSHKLGGKEIEAIEEAVKYHHTVDHTGVILGVVKEADKKAREKEILDV